MGTQQSGDHTGELGDLWNLVYQLRRLISNLSTSTFVLRAETTSGGNTLSNQATPTLAILAAAHFTPAIDGRMLVSGFLQYTDSVGGDTITITAVAYDAVTSVTGGTDNTLGVTYNGGSPVVITGGTPTTVAVAETAIPSSEGPVIGIVPFSFPYQATVGHSSALALEISTSSGGTFSLMKLYLAVAEA
jgi:hypothetical protein